jgi:hypothetical protein
MVCERCGQEHLTVHGHPACPGHILSGDRQGQPCTHELGYGTVHKGYGHCKFHGGNTLTHNKNAAAEMIDREARAMLGIEGFEPITDPYTELSELAGEIVKLKDVLRDKVEELTNLKDVGDENVATQIDVLFQAYERSIDRCERILMGMARLDLEDRIARLHTRINSDMAAQIIGSMNAALDAAVVPDALREVVIREFSNRLSGSNEHRQTQALGAG